MHRPTSLLVDGDVAFYSGFDSGNLAAVKRIGLNQYECYVSPDCGGTPNEAPYTTWFHFCVAGCAKGTTLTFTLLNLNVQATLYSQQMTPVYRAVPSMAHYLRIPGRVAHTVLKDATHMQLMFQHTFHQDREEVFFAFAYPYSYGELQAAIAAWLAACPARPNPRPEDIYLMRESLAHSIDGRAVDLLTITNHAGMDVEASEQGGYIADVPVRCHSKVFPAKKVICFSARVHPGETPASHMLHGTVEFLLSDDPRALLARQHFVFQVVPMLNPDGVYRGHYRTDTFGTNLNRCYIDPDPVREPAVYALKKLLLALHSTQHLALYVDLHGHATRRGAFMYGNAVPETDFVDMLLYPKLVALNTPYFDFAACNFTERNMVAKGKRDGLSKEGSSRVNVYQETGLIHSYTLEANYNTVLNLNRMTYIDLDLQYPATQADGLATAFPEHFPQSLAGLTPKFIPEMYHDIGRALVVAVLDMFEVNTRSRLPFTYFQNTAGVRAWVERNAKLVLDPPHKMKSAAGQARTRLALQESGAPLRAAVHSTEPEAPSASMSRRASEKRPKPGSSSSTDTGRAEKAQLQVVRRKSAPAEEGVSSGRSAVPASKRLSAAGTGVAGVGELLPTGPSAAHVRRAVSLSASSLGPALGGGGAAGPAAPPRPLRGLSQNAVPVGKTGFNPKKSTSRLNPMPKLPLRRAAKTPA
eukprot:EG_transcript_3825